MCVNPIKALGGLLMPGGGGDAPQPAAPPQMPKLPETAALKRKPIGGMLPAPAGGTMLTGSSGIADASLLLGGTSLLGGGKG